MPAWKFICGWIYRLGSRVLSRGVSDSMSESRREDRAGYVCEDLNEIKPAQAIVKSDKL